MTLSMMAMSASTTDFTNCIDTLGLPFGFEGCHVNNFGGPLYNNRVILAENQLARPSWRVFLRLWCGKSLTLFVQALKMLDSQFWGDVPV